MKRAGLIFLVIVIIITGILRLNYLVKPVEENSNQDIGINIKAGNSSLNIAEKLEEKNLIRSKLLFIFIINFYGIDDQLKAGYYEFSPADSLREIIRNLTEGKIATFNITIPEGYTVEDVAVRLEELTAYDKEDFLNIAQNDDLIPLDRDLSDTDYTDSFKYPLEGFLYPDTYTIPYEYNPEEILKVMVNQFQEKWQEKYLNKVKDQTENDSELGFYEYLIIASLIEKEAKLDEEKKTISSVIHNRIKEDMPLQIDASVQYILPEWKDRLLYNDLKEESPYNTYLFKGLPRGPICNPGKQSLEAAIEPSDEEYLFYFAEKDGSHVFTKTYEEHLEKQNELLDDIE